MNLYMDHGCGTVHSEILQINRIHNPAFLRKFLCISPVDILALAHIQHNRIVLAFTHENAVKSTNQYLCNQIVLAHAVSCVSSGVMTTIHVGVGDVLLVHT